MMEPSALPVPNATVPFWRMEPHPLDEHRSTEELPAECEILIIGAGSAGIATAYHLLDENASPPSIVLLEARQACSGASGRSVGQLTPFPNIAAFERYGSAAAVEVALFEIAHLEAIRDLVKRERIDCEFSGGMSQHVVTNPRIHEGLKDLIKAMEDSCPQISHNWHFFEREMAEGVSTVKGALALYLCDAEQFSPYQFFMHLLDHVVAKGINLQTNTPVLSISERVDADGFWHITTSRGNIKARNVVHATNGYTSALLPEYTAVIFPVRDICSHIKIPRREIAPKSSCNYCINFDQSWDYLIQRDDRSIIIGGGRALFRDDAKQWQNNVNDDALIEPARHYFDGYLQRTFGDWKTSGAYVDRIWTGISGHTSDSLPHIGSVPNKHSQFILSGCNRHGMPVIFLAAKGIAHMIRDGKTFEETDVPSVFKTTEQRLKQKAENMDMA